LSKALILFWQELRLLMRDRQALALLFVMPLALIVFLTFALQDVYQAKIGKTLALTVVTVEKCDDGTSCGDLIAQLKRFNYQITFAKDQASANADLILVLPADTQATIHKLEEQKPLAAGEQLQLLFDPLIDQASRALVEGHLMLSLQAILISRLQKEMRGSPLEQRLVDVSKFDGLLEKRALGGVVLPNPIQQTVPAWALFGMFFILIPLTNSMIRDRRSGVFKRLLSFPVNKWQLVIGKVLPFLVINVLQFAIMFLVGYGLLPRFTGLAIPWDFSIAGLCLVTVACAMAATSYGLLVSCFARTSEQAHAFGAFSIVILAIVGGVMVPRFVMPTFMQNAAYASPLFWGLDSYLDLTVRKLPLVAVASKVAGLVLFSVVALAISVFSFKWSEEH